MLTPNLWITGLPKAGTSSLFSTLEAHPDITGTRPKETFFLLDPDSKLLNQRTNYWRDGENAWGQFIPQGNQVTSRYFLEGTTHLFFQNESLGILQRYHADSLFIIMLRDPAERIYSSFVYTRDTLVRMPASISFSRYVADLFAGRPLSYISHPVSRFVLSRELDYSNYHTFLERWYNAFSHQHIFLGLFEDFVDDNSAFMERLFGFLKLDGIALSTRHSNPTVAYRRPGLHKIMLQAARYFPLGTRLKDRLKGTYTKHFSARRPSITDEDLEAKQILRKHFSSGNERIKNKYSLDISKWS